MTCCSTCVSGFAASVTLIAFIFDLALFFLAKDRINKVPGGSATIGNAIWLTLAALVLLFFSGCFYTLGRCCISDRSGGKSWDRKLDGPGHMPGPHATYAEQMRLDAVKAEADRKARQQQGEGGLPSFPESTPLRARIDGDEVFLDEEDSHGSYRDYNNVNNAPRYGTQPPPNARPAATGYVPGPAGSRTVDQYYSQNADTTSTYPPQPPTRQPSVAYSAYAPSNYSTPSYAPSNYQHNPATAPPLPTTNNSYLYSNQQYGADRYASPSHDYGHTAGGTTCERLILA